MDLNELIRTIFESHINKNFYSNTNSYWHIWDKDTQYIYIIHMKLHMFFMCLFKEIEWELCVEWRSEMWKKENILQGNHHIVPNGGGWGF